MIIIKLKVNKQVTTEHWKQMASGQPDEYGNPFRIVRLRWNKSSLHKVVDYTKTRGFEDAIIAGNARTGEISINYRSNGSILWMKPPGGIGPSMGEVAVTPKNMRRLAAAYGDKLWTILDPDIANQVKTMHEEMIKNLPPDVREFNEKRVKGMHQMSLEKDDKGLRAPEVPLDADKLNATETARLQQIKAMDLAKREEALNMKEAAIESKITDQILQGGSPVTYSKEFLAGKKLHELRRLAKEVAVDWSEADKKDDLVSKILLKQEGKLAEAATTASQVEDALDI